MKLVSGPQEPISLRGRRQFSRGGPLQPALVVSLLLTLVRHGEERGYTRMLEVFWDEARDFGLELPQEQPATAQTFSQARGKRPSAVVRGLLHRAADEFDARHGGAWRGA